MAIYVADPTNIVLTADQAAFISPGIVPFHVFARFPITLGPGPDGVVTVQGDRLLVIADDLIANLQAQSSFTPKFDEATTFSLQGPPEGAGPADDPDLKGLKTLIAVIGVTDAPSSVDDVKAALMFSSDPTAPFAVIGTGTVGNGLYESVGSGPSTISTGLCGIIKRLEGQSDTTRLNGVVATGNAPTGTFSLEVNDTFHFVSQVSYLGNPAYIDYAVTFSDVV